MDERCKALKCPAVNCSFASSLTKDFLSHSYEAHKKTNLFLCNKCRFVCRNSDSLLKHLDSKHSEGDGGSDVDIFILASSLFKEKLGKYNHKFNIFCKFCSFTTNGVENFKGHLETHYKATYASGINLEERNSSAFHRNSRTMGVDRKSLECPVLDCPFASSLTGDFLSHSKEVHPNTNIFLCVRCKMVYTTSIKLLTHIDSKHPAGKGGSVLKIFIQASSDLKDQLAMRKYKFTIFCKHCSLTTNKVEKFNCHLETHNKTTCELGSNEDEGNSTSPRNSGTVVDKGKVFTLKCPVSDCSFASSLPKVLLLHSNEMHPNTSIFHCKKCKFVCETNERLLKHIDSTHPVGSRLTIFIHTASDLKDELLIRNYRFKIFCKPCSFSTCRVETFKCHLETHKKTTYDSNSNEEENNSIVPCNSWAMDDNDKENDKCKALMLQCPVSDCSFASSSTRVLLFHSNETHPNTSIFLCKKCRFVCETSERLLKHIYSTHPEGSNLTIFIHTASDLKDELLIRNYRFKIFCKPCSFSTNRVEAFKCHLETHKKTTYDFRSNEEENNSIVPCINSWAMDDNDKENDKCKALMLQCPVSACSFASFLPREIVSHSYEVHPNASIFHCKKCKFVCETSERLLKHIDSTHLLGSKLTIFIHTASDLKDELFIRNHKVKIFCKPCSFSTNKVQKFKCHIEAHNKTTDDSGSNAKENNSNATRKSTSGLEETKAFKHPSNLEDLNYKKIKSDKYRSFKHGASAKTARGNSKKRDVRVQVKSCPMCRASLYPVPRSLVGSSTSRRNYECKYCDYNVCRKKDLFRHNLEHSRGKKNHM